MRRFARHGYAQTTVEQIAREAEVSHTTFFRYFASKEQVVIGDDLEDARAAAMNEIPPGLGHFDLLRTMVRAQYRIATADPWASSVERMRLIQSEPALRMAYQIESPTPRSSVPASTSPTISVCRRTTRISTSSSRRPPG